MPADQTGIPGPDRPVPYSLTPRAEVELAEAEARATAIDVFCGRPPGTADRLYAQLEGPDPEATWEAVAEAADEWDSRDSGRHQARVEAGLEPEAGL
jgi:hypothetical protein